MSRPPNLSALLVVLGTIGSAFVLAQSTTPDTSETRIVDNSRVLVSDVLWNGASLGTVEHMRHESDTVSVSLTAGAVRVTNPDGTSRMVTRKIGEVWFEPKRTAVRDGPDANAPPPRTIVIELKDANVLPLANKSGFPNAFPRPGSKKVLDNNRVVAWDYTWTPGAPTPMHFHDKDVVVVYLAEGVLASTTPDGAVVNNPHHFGFTKFNTRDRSHTETLVEGHGRAIIVELK